MNITSKTLPDNANEVALWEMTATYVQDCPGR